MDSSHEGERGRATRVPVRNGRTPKGKALRTARPPSGQFRAARRRTRVSNLVAGPPSRRGAIAPRLKDEVVTSGTRSDPQRKRGCLKIESKHSEASRHSADRQPLLRRTRCFAKSRQPRMRPTRALKERLIRSKHDAGDPAAKTAEETRCYNVPFRYSIRRSRLMTGRECTSGRRRARSFASSSAKRCGSADGWAGWPQPAVLFHRQRPALRARHCRTRFEPRRRCRAGRRRRT